MRSITKSLPQDKVEYMHHVRILVEIMAKKLNSIDIFRRYPHEFQYYSGAAAYYDIGKV